MAHIRTHPKTGKPQVRWLDQNKKEHSKTFDRMVDARRFKAEVEVSVNRGEFIDPERGRLTVDEWCKEWLEGRVGVRPSTRARDESYIRNYITSELGRTRLSGLTFEQIQTWVRILEDRGLAPGTVRKAHQLLGQILDRAVRARRIHWNPARGVELPQDSKTDRRRFLTVDEIEALASTIDSMYRAMVLVGAYAGLRWGESAGLRVESVDVLRRTLTVDRTLVEVNGELSLGPPKTPGSIRQVSLPSFLAAELSDHLTRWPPTENGLVFTSKEGGPLRHTNFRRRYWMPAVKAAGLAPLRYHDLRHSHAALLIAQGEHPKLIADRLGHSNPIVTMTTYAHLFPGLDRAAADRLDGLRHGPTTDPGESGEVIGPP